MLRYQKFNKSTSFFFTFRIVIIYFSYNSDLELLFSGPIKYLAWQCFPVPFPHIFEIVIGDCTLSWILERICILSLQKINIKNSFLSETSSNSYKNIWKIIKVLCLFSLSYLTQLGCCI